jgi:hypothetical protein
MQSGAGADGREVSRRRVIGVIAAAGSGVMLRTATDATAKTAVQPGATPSPSASLGRVGMPAWWLTVETFQDPYAGVIQQPAQPPPGTRYLAAEVVIENASNQALNFTPADVRLRDATGQEFRGGTAVGTEPFIAPRNLNGGERSRGWVWFTAPADAKIVEIAYVAPPAELRVTLSGRRPG